MSVLDELKAKPWFPWALGCGVLVILFWLLFWTTPDPIPSKVEQRLRKLRIKRKVFTISRSARGRTASTRILKRRENRSLRWI